MEVRRNGAISDWNSGISPLPELSRQNDKYQGSDLNFTAGNHAEFTLVFNAFYEHLCLFSCKLINDWDSGEDIVVDVFMRLWNTQGRFIGTGSLKRWLYKVTFNRCMNHLKRVKRPVYSNTDALENNNKLTEIVDKEILKEIYSVIEGLPTKCKAVIKLYYFDGLEYEGIAKLFNISINTVKNQKARGIHLVKAQLNKSVLKSSFH
jgi:RNA polymerase sigma-70 factor (family 1)